MKHSHKKIFFTSGDTEGCSLWRTIFPAKMLNQEYSLGFPPRDMRLVTSDIIILQRATHEGFLKIIPILQKDGKKIVYDIDDNFWEIPSYNPVHRAYPSEMLKTVKQIIKLCDACVVSTDEMNEYFTNRSLNKNIHTIQNTLPCWDYPILPKDDSRIRIGWAATLTHSGDMNKELLFALDKLTNEFDNVELVFVGYNPFSKWNKKVEHYEYIEAKEFLNFYNELRLDIGIMPLVDNTFNSCKSDVKYIENSVSNTVCVASNVAPYRKSIKHDETGKIIVSDKEWYNTLKTLIQDKPLRNRLANNAYKDVTRNRVYENNKSYINDCYDRLIRSIW